MNGMGGKDQGLDNGHYDLPELSSQLQKLAETGHDHFQMGATASPTAALLQGISISLANEQQEHLIVNLRRLLVSINDAIRRYASSSDQDTAAAIYLDFCLDAVTKSTQAFQKLGLDQELATLLAEHGYASTDLSGYHAHLCALYAQAKREHLAQRPALRRTITATYSSETFAEPRPRVNPPIEEETTGIVDLPVAVPTPERRNPTSLGMGNHRAELKQMGEQNQPVIPPHTAVDSIAALGQIFDEVTTPNFNQTSGNNGSNSEHAATPSNGTEETASESILGENFAEEKTTVNNPQLEAAIAREQAVAMASQMPPAPTAIEQEDEADYTDPNLDMSKFRAVAAAHHSNNQKNGNSSASSANVAMEPSPLTVPLPTATEIAADTTVQAPEIPVAPTAAPTAPVRDPMSETGAFTSAWVQGEGKKYGHNEVKRGNTPPPSQRNGRGFTGITQAPVLAPKVEEAPRSQQAPLLYPSQYSTVKNSVNSATPAPQQTPASVKKSTRGRVYTWLAAATIGLVGLGAGAKMLHDSQSGKAEQQTTSTNTTPAPTTTPSSTPSNQESTNPAPVVDKKVEAESEKGIFKVDTNHPSYKKYLNDIKSSSGLVAMIKDFAGQVKVDYYQDPAEQEAARKRGNLVLAGTEPESEQRMMMMEAFLDHALKSNIDNGWVVNLFSKSKKALANFKKTGTWDHEGLKNGADKLFEAFQAPVKLVAPPEVIGYAVDINPVTNPAILKVKDNAPTFYLALQEAGKRLQAETDPAKVVPYDDFNMIKTATCAKIMVVRGEYKDADARSGIAFMHGAWCKGTTNPYNYLNSALKKTIPIMGVKAPQPQQAVPPQAPVTPTHNNIIQQNKFEQPMGAPVMLNQGYGQPASKPVEQPKPGIFSRAASKIKSLFGFGKKQEAPEPAAPAIQKPIQPQPQPIDQPLPQAYLQPRPSVEPEFTKKDIPMYTWKETLANYFWG